MTSSSVPSHFNPRTELALGVVLPGCLIVTSGQFPGATWCSQVWLFSTGETSGYWCRRYVSPTDCFRMNPVITPDKSGLLTATILVLSIGCTWLPVLVPVRVREDSMASRCLGAAPGVPLRFFKRRPQSPLSVDSAGYSRVVPFVGSALHASISWSQVLRIWFCHLQFVGGGRQSV